MFMAAFLEMASIGLFLPFLELLAEIKQEWIEIFYELLLPLVSLPNICPLERAPYLMIIAEKK